MFFCRSRRLRTPDLRFWRPTFCQLNYTPIMLYSRQDLHLQPAVYKTDALTVAPREHLSLHCGTSWSRTTFYGFSVRRIHHVCQSSILLRRLRDLNPWTPFLGPPVFKTGAINQTLPNLHLTCGKGRTRTYSALGQQIYSLPRLSNFAAFPFCGSRRI